MILSGAGIGERREIYTIFTGKILRKNDNEAGE
jgi:hypothetical protein